MRTMIFIIVMWLPFFAGCVSQNQRLNNKSGTSPYIPVSGNVYDTQGISFKFTCPPRFDGTDEYIYSLKQGAVSFSSPVKYLLFDVFIHNPLQREVRISLDNVKLVGSNHDTYLPLDNIMPDTNKTRYLTRNITEFQRGVFGYGIIVFEPIPKWEHEIKLQFQIDIDDQTDFHYVIFHQAQ